MNPLRVWCIVVGVVHLALIVAMYSNFYQEFISDEMDRLPMFKLATSALVIVEIATSAVYITVILNGLPARMPCTTCLSMCACVLASCGWVVLCVFPASIDQHHEGFIVFAVGTAVYTLCMLYLSHVAAGNRAFARAMMCVFALLYGITAALLIAFLATRAKRQKHDAALLEWGTFLSLTFNYTIYFLMHPFNAASPLHQPVAMREAQRETDEAFFSEEDDPAAYASKSATYDSAGTYK